MSEGWRALLTIAVIAAHPGGSGDDVGAAPVDEAGAARGVAGGADRAGHRDDDDDGWLHVELVSP